MSNHGPLSDVAPTRRGRNLLTLGALGIVFGDIGTSPLYALREVFDPDHGLTPDRATVLGILSVVVWSLVVVVGVKYVIILMRADNDGEGGVMALAALVAPMSSRQTGRSLLVALGLFGTALLYGDGVITPAISILSAVEGLGVVTPTLDPFVIPITAAILLALFAGQHWGTASIGRVFGPIMVLWFGTLGALGLVHLVSEPSILAAFDPRHAVRLFAEHPAGAFLALGAIFLVVTGSEALYADMGHFGREPIRRAWWGLVMPALMLNYLGQGAFILSDPTVIDNPFYRMAPGWTLIPLVMLATAATVIASQALISGAFSLTLQAVHLGYLPRVRIRHTSPEAFGQIYVPSVNWMLMASCLVLVVTFQSSSALAAAYGVAVTATMVVTTVLLARLMLDRWEWPIGRTALVIGVFLTIDIAFLSANLLKIPDGGWLPLVIGAAVYAVMTVWRSGRNRMADAVGRALPIERFIASIRDNPQTRIPGTAVYLFSDRGAVPPALLANLRHNEVIHETVIIVTVMTADTARVPKARRATFHDLGDGFHQVVLLYGFMEQIDVPKDLAEITDPRFGFDPTDARYVLANRHILSRGDHRFADQLFAAMHRNAASAADHFGLPADDVIELGILIELSE